MYPYYGYGGYRGPSVLEYTLMRNNCNCSCRGTYYDSYYGGYGGYPYYSRSSYYGGYPYYSGYHYH